MSYLFKMRIRPDYVKLLDLLAQVLSADNYLSFGGADDNERLSIARGLTDKFINHAVTLLYLSRGTKQNLPSLKFASYLYDFASIDVLTRASLEACLTLNYIFYAPATKEERDYRYWVYKAAGIAERKNFPALSKEAKQKLVDERKELDKLLDKLKSNTIFQGLRERQKAQFIKGKNRDLWRWCLAARKTLSWAEIAIRAGFSKMLASDVYSYLSGSAHSIFLSVLQSVETQVNMQQEEAIRTSMVIMNRVIANMVIEYCRLFPRARNVLSTDHEGLEIVDWWFQVDRGLDEFTNIGQEND